MCRLCILSIFIRKVECSNTVRPDMCILAITKAEGEALNL